MICSAKASFPLAAKFREGQASVAEVFSFLSGLYFRGKVAYASQFANPPEDANHAYVVTSNQGLMTLDQTITPEVFAGFSAVPITPAETSYLEPLHRDLNRLEEKIDRDTQMILLGSIATEKYVAPLLEHFTFQLYYPGDFKGRGDMSRGALMLRAADSAHELQYSAVTPHFMSASGKRLHPNFG